MSLIRHLVGGLRALVFKRDVDRELDDEVRQYIEMSAREKIRHGASRDVAEREARLEFGGVETVKENLRAMGWETMVDVAWRDVRFAARSLRRSPAFAITAVITLALGVGANTAMFSVVNAVLLRPLPYAAADRLATLWTDDVRHGSKEEGTSNLNFLDWRARSRSFADMAVVSRGRPAMLGGDEPERLNGEDISANLLPLLGARPLLGRNLAAAEEFNGGVAILSYGLWQRRFGGRPEIVGETMDLDGAPVRVIGVMPGEFFFPRKATQLWLSSPLVPRERMQRTQDTWRVIGRLRPGVTFAQAQREMTAIGEQLAAEYPTTDAGFGGYAVNVVPMLTQIVGPNTSFALWLLLGAVSLVLAIACLNVANLLLARATARGHELALRSALGASRARLVRQLFAESVLLSGGSAVVGAGFAWAIVAGVRRIAVGTPRIDEVGLDWRVLVFTAAVAIVAAVLFGLAPAWRGSRRDPIDALRAGGRSGSGARSTRGVRRTLVMAECGLAVVLMSGAALLVRSLSRVNDVDAGFKARGALLVRVALPELRSEEREQRSRAGDERMARIVERVRTISGVLSAGAMRDFVFDKNPDWVITADGPNGLSTLDVRGELTGEYVGAGLFPAAGASFVTGRDFTESEFGSAHPVVINESLAKRYFPGSNAVGRHIKEGPPTSTSSWLTVIGVVRDMHRGGLERRALPEFYMPWYARNMDIIVRADPRAEGLAPSLRQVIRETEPRAAIMRVSSLEDALESTGSPRRLNTLLLAMFAALALVLSAVGIYGVVHFLVSQRTQEIGVRLALGARTSDAIALVMREGIIIAVAGVALGLGATLALTGLMGRLVFGISAHDPASFGGGAAVLVAIALVASWVPARRAARIDPMTALRRE